MKKQLLIAAVAATMTSAAMADISIAGSGKLNYTNTDISASADGSTIAASSTNAFGTDLVVTLTGKSGDTSVVIKQEFNDAAVDTDDTDGAVAGMETKAAYMTSNIAGVNVKAGSWIGADSNMGNGTMADGRFSADYTVSGVKVQYEDRNGEEIANPSSFTVSGAVQGVSLSHEMFVNEDTDTKVSGSIAGVSIAYRAYDVDTTTAASTTQDKESIVVGYTTNGVTLTYADVDVDGVGRTTSDAFFGTQATAVGDMTGFGLSTAVAGNTIALKSYSIDPTNAVGSSDDDYTKVVITRPLASGATFEATYTDKDAGANTIADTETLDLELAVKF